MISRFWLILAVVIFLGCKENASPSSSQSDSENDHSFDDSVQISPLFLCPPGEAIVGFRASGQPICDFASEEGFPAAQKGDSTLNEFNCPRNFKAEIQVSAQKSTKSSLWVACFYDKDAVPRPVSFGQEAASAFQCPEGSFLTGFDGAEPLHLQNPHSPYSLRPMGQGLGK